MFGTCRPLKALSAKVPDSSHVFTNVYGLARSLIAFGSLTTLAFSSTEVLFSPLAGVPEAPQCTSPAVSLGLFCVMGERWLHEARLLGILVLLMTVAGWKPRFLGVLHAYVSLSMYMSLSIKDGGDQIASMLSLMLVPATLLDSRDWHWSAPPQAATLPAALAYPWLLICRIQVSFLYWHASVGKLRETTWRNGTALYYISKSNMFGFAFPGSDWLLGNAVVVLSMTWGVLIAEALLSMGLLASADAKKGLLILGCLLHLGIALFMSLPSFSIVMFGALLLYLRPFDQELPLRKMLSSMRDIVLRLRTTSLHHSIDNS
ncbi:MAG: sporulation-delaying protein SdpB family protein [Myxococcota bacterium]